MLIRRPGSRIFHVVQEVTEDGRFFISLCGVLVENENLEAQSRSNYPYERCWPCQKLQRQRWLEHYSRKR